MSISINGKMRRNLLKVIGLKFHSKKNYIQAGQNDDLGITYIENDHGPSMIKRHKPLQILIFTKRRLCCHFSISIF